MLRRIDEILERHGCESSSLIQVLLEIQRELRWLPEEALARVGEKLDVPRSRIQHIATFYKAFSLVPKGRYELQVCMGTACHVRGAPRVLDKVEAITGIAPGETDLHLKFSLETVNCLGCCALGPVIEINGETHGKLTSSTTANLLADFE